MSKLSVDPKSTLKLLKLLARTCPQDQYIREFIQNAIEAIMRGALHGISPPGGGVYLARDRLYNKKIVIANTKPSDPFTKQIVNENLLSLGRSGNDDDVNYGSGSKLSYLPLNPQGILFRSRSMGKQWVMYVNEKASIIELCRFETEDPETGETKEEIYLDCSEEEFCFSDSETEVVLLGATEDEDTWLKATHDVGRTGKASPAGYAIWDYINTKYWSTPEDVTIKVHIYDPKTGEEKEVRIAHGLENYKTKQKVHGCVDLRSGIKVHYYALNSYHTKSAHVLAGTIGFLHQNEIILQKERSPSATKRLMHQAGVHTRPNDVLLIIEVPDDSGWEQSVERGQLVKDGEQIITHLSDYLEEFREKFPDPLKSWMESHLDKQNTTIETEAKRLMGRLRSRFQNPNKVKSTKGNSTGLGSSASGTPHSSSRATSATPAVPPKKRQKRKSQDRMGNKAAPSDADPPTFMMSDEDPDEPMVQWNIPEYAVKINTGSDIFKSLLAQVCEGESYPVKVATLTIAESGYLTAVRYYSFLCYTQGNKSEDLLLEKLEGDKLDSSAVTNFELSKTRSRVQRKMSKGNN